MLNNIYNFNYQIIQTPDNLVIVVEIVHDVRTIPIHTGKALSRESRGAAALQP
ncbi:MAG: hypothetical protein MH112_04455 [Phenylobacterium sp.]|uniref:hypothetical protein n=1 Tax=Phenylobacterium sp. TaxID=1871053 RepID=UPI0025F0B30A|nr:hypothetical protein [Phenylobacterium sp.]MCG9915598.1 hypothetical protein [Phenylobacterium sp.]